LYEHLSIGLALKILNEKDVEHLIFGAAILGTGGGGDPKEGLKMLKKDLKDGRRLAIISLDEVPDDALIVCPYFCGSTAPSKKKRKPVVFKDPMVVAFEKIEKHMGKRAFATVAVELGGANTAIPLHIASLMNLPLLDGDYLGRAGPELLHSSANIFGISLLPCVAVSQEGDIVIIERYADLNEYENIVRSLSVVAGGFVAVVDTPVDGKVAKKVVIKDTISKCIEVGKTVKEANVARRDPITELVKCLNGVLLFKGLVKNYEWEDREGFLYGEATYEGVEKWKGHAFKIWIKNENIIAWTDGKVTATSPDPICVVNEKGYAITNAELKEGMKAVVIGAKAPKVWLTPKGIELFGPKHFGFSFDYTPINE
jgi:DUF917 family protein